MYLSLGIEVEEGLHKAGVGSLFPRDVNFINVVVSDTVALHRYLLHQFYSPLLSTFNIFVCSYIQTFACGCVRVIYILGI